MFYFAKLVQAIGFADVGYGLYVGINNEHGMGQELRLLLLGIVIFYLGRALEKRVAR
jgi:hypothetical protein